MDAVKTVPMRRKGGEKQYSPQICHQGAFGNLCIIFALAALGVSEHHVISQCKKNGA
jgi:hypothetical protein